MHTDNFSSTLSCYKGQQIAKVCFFTLQGMGERKLVFIFF